MLKQSQARLQYLIESDGVILYCRAGLACRQRQGYSGSMANRSSIREFPCWESEVGERLHALGQKLVLSHEGHLLA